MINQLQVSENFEEDIDPEFRTENIGKTTSAGMRYPCLVLDGEAEIGASLVGMIRTLSKPVVRVVRGTDGVEVEKKLEEGMVQDIALYLDSGGQYNLLGLLNGAGVTTILELMFPEDDLSNVKSMVGWLDADTPLKGNGLLVLRN